MSAVHVIKSIDDPETRVCKFTGLIKAVNKNLSSQRFILTDYTERTEEVNGKK